VARVLGPAGGVRLVPPPGGEPLAPGDVVLLASEGLEIRALRASDGRRAPAKGVPRPPLRDVEGLLAFRVAEQETVLPWSARVSEARDGTRRYEVREPERLRGRLLFAGPPGLLALEAGLVESDAQWRAGLSQAERIAELAAQLARALPGPGAAAGGALSLVGALLAFARATSRDDLELRLLAALGDGARRALRVGSWRIERRGSGGAELAFAFGMHRVAPGALRAGAIFLDAIELDLPAARERDELVFEAAVGAGRFARRLAFSEPLANATRGGLENVLGIDGALLYAGPLSPPAPFRFVAATLRDAERARALADLVATGARAAVPLLDAEARRAAGAAARAVESALAVALDFLPEKGFDARAEGVVGAGAGEAAEAALGPALWLLGGEPAAVARRTLVLAGPQGGEIRLRLRVVAAGAPRRAARASATARRTRAGGAPRRGRQRVQ
jgi:hypothetical protein